MLVAGLGVSGLSAVRFLLAQGAEVDVWDATRSTEKLAEFSYKLDNKNNYTGQNITTLPLQTYTAGVVSPGIALTHPLVQALNAAQIPVIGDIELFARAANDAGVPVIGVTGSNGKSTVTTLVGEMAKAAGLNVGVGGNLGPPALDLLRDDAELYVLELSSFQLETTHSLRCRAATILNLSQDHLDRHGTMAHYGEVKARIWNDCAVAVANRDDAAVMRLARESGVGNRESSKQLTFGLDAPDEVQSYGLLE
ncbi:MAG: UDP-N-acetylmuramoyl-L-alanine--D-glutamate ligase, partial [Stenotrophobium sp.]